MAMSSIGDSVKPESRHAAVDQPGERGQRGSSERPQVTIRDLARHAGVSTGTISRALKNEPGLTEAVELVVRASTVCGDFRVRPYF